MPSAVASCRNRSATCARAVRGPARAKRCRRGRRGPGIGTRASLAATWTSTPAWPSRPACSMRRSAAIGNGIRPVSWTMRQGSSPSLPAGRSSALEIGEDEKSNAVLLGVPRRRQSRERAGAERRHLRPALPRTAPGQSRPARAAHGPFPFIVDDILLNFDDARACAALHCLADLGNTHAVDLLQPHPCASSPHCAALGRIPGQHRGAEPAVIRNDWSTAASIRLWMRREILPPNASFVRYRTPGTRPLALACGLPIPGPFNPLNPSVGIFFA